ncbi:MAG: TetR/AcrR family transcriptional regulator [Actinobacteria bacterium]|nr:TetR/AcrR family transcriptional regulator [Actinomycetota bacterium]
MPEPTTSPAIPTEDEPRAVDGRVPGRRGMATRRRLLECTAAMVRRNAYRDVKVVDIAREAGTSPATFYQYFPDVESAVLALAEDLTEEGKRFAELVTTTTWRGADGFEAANELAGAYLRFWDEHRPVLKVIDLATSEGDARFRDLRTSFLADTAQALRDAISRMQIDGRHPDSMDPAAMSGVLVSMLANVAAHRRGLEEWGVAPSALQDAMARVIFWAVSGQKPRQTA